MPRRHQLAVAVQALGAGLPSPLFLAVAGRPVVAHRPLVAVMVGHTVLSLWIISQPVVR